VLVGLHSNVYNILTYEKKYWKEAKFWWKKKVNNLWRSLWESEKKFESLQKRKQIRKLSVSCNPSILESKIFYFFLPFFFSVHTGGFGPQSQNCWNLFIMKKSFFFKQFLGFHFFIFRVWWKQVLLLLDLNCWTQEFPFFNSIF